MSTPPPPQQSPQPPAAPPAQQAFGQQAPPAQQPFAQQPPAQQAPGQQAPGQPAFAGGGYSSPIPVVKTHLGHALASEWTKIRTVRSTMWTLALTLVLTVGIGLAFAAALSSDDYTGMPLLAGGYFGLMFSQICVITLGVLVVTSEFATGMIRTTFTACPQRPRVLLAKALVFFGLAFTVTLVATSLTALIHSSMLGGQTVPDWDWDDPIMEGSVENGELIASSGHWMGATVGASLYVALLGLMALAVGTLLRHSAGAITFMLGVVLVPLLAAMFMVGEALSGLRDALIEYSPLNGLASLFRIPMIGEEPTTGWGMLGLLAAVTAALLAAAFARLTTTDV
ncbi:ABC transporter permease [Streptomyces sp. DSM 44915]|uniref:ABC transporter permease n=1 Tax=Streptomyces chisholmiae TaxID=3075540 RepID=A0ABU2JI57_9ACTN|nr:ABC transporter permease [Streptomyces sp. DSM 44915]MDT0264676.1 ABC transporter permease [Streptomyces sp. DSM 44915]